MTKIRYFHRCLNCGGVVAQDRDLDSIELMAAQLPVHICNKPGVGTTELLGKLDIGELEASMQKISFVLGSFDCGGIPCDECLLKVADKVCFHDIVAKVQEKL